MDYAVAWIKLLGHRKAIQELDALKKAASRREDPLAYALSIEELEKIGIIPEYDSLLYWRGVWAIYNDYNREREADIERTRRERLPVYSKFVKSYEKTKIDINNPFVNGQRKAELLEILGMRGLPASNGEVKPFDELNLGNPFDLIKLNLVFRNLLVHAKMMIRKR